MLNSSWKRLHKKRYQCWIYRYYPRYPLIRRLLRQYMGGIQNVLIPWILCIKTITLIPREAYHLEPFYRYPWDSHFTRHAFGARFYHLEQKQNAMQLSCWACKLKKINQAIIDRKHRLLGELTSRSKNPQWKWYVMVAKLAPSFCTLSRRPSWLSKGAGWVCALALFGVIYLHTGELPSDKTDSLLSSTTTTTTLQHAVDTFFIRVQHVGVALAYSCCGCILGVRNEESITGSLHSLHPT